MNNNHTKTTDRHSMNTPASKWEEAFPIGNGRMGAMVFGRVATEILALNEDSLWYGGKRDRINPNADEAVPLVQKALSEGNHRLAENLSVYGLSGIPDNQRHYEPLGNLYLHFDLGNEHEEYERTLDFANALATTSFKQNGITYKRECIASFPDQVIAVHLSADKDRSISFHTQLSRGNITWDDSPYTEQTYRNPGYHSHTDSCVNLSSNTTLMTGQAGGKDGVTYACGIRVLIKEGKMSSLGNTLIIKDADEALILVSAYTSFYKEDQKAAVLTALDKASISTWEELYKAHSEDFSSLYNRMTLTLPDGEADVVRLFQFGRYLMISGSRPGSQPLNLQGIWNPDFNPPWGSRYTININTQMNYWPAETCNLPECHLPLFDLLKRMRPNGRETAQRMYGCVGFVAHHNTDLWGDCAPQDSCLSSSYWVMGAAWLSLHIWEHYLFTKDIDFLKKHYDIMMEAAEFLLDFLTEEGDYLVISPSVSPENEYYDEKGEKAVLCSGAAMDNQIMRELFQACIKAHEIVSDHNENAAPPPLIKSTDFITELFQSGNSESKRDIYSDLIEEIEDTLKYIAPIQLNKDGGIREWNKDYKEADPGHRHLSHLFALYPGHQITPETPELMAACEKTLEKRLANGSGHTGWSRAWIINLYARLQNGEEAYKHAHALLESSLLPNLFDNHPPFQIDGNFGFTAGIVEMLVQSTEDNYTLLPALPKRWQSGSITGVRLRTGQTIDFKWENGKVVSKKIH